MLRLELLTDLVLEQKVGRRRTLWRVRVLGLRLPSPLAALPLFVTSASLALPTRWFDMGRRHLGKLAIWEHHRGTRVGNRCNELCKLFCESCAISHCFGDGAQATDELAATRAYQEEGVLRETTTTHLHLCVLELRLALRKMRHVLV